MRYKHSVLFNVIKKFIESSTNVNTYSALVYKNYYSFNISIQFISLIRMYKNNVNFVFVASELQNVKFLYYLVYLNSLQYVRTVAHMVAGTANLGVGCLILNISLLESAPT